VKISICIPQYNRIEYLKIALAYLENQAYRDIEVCISDDASTDSTRGFIMAHQKEYKYPLLYYRFSENKGYDRNLRKSLEMATGDYCFILGNDDTLEENAITELVDLIRENNYPGLGFCNSKDFLTGETLIRANQTALFPAGFDTALKFYSSFSFVAGLFISRKAFEEVNDAEVDGSVYVQIYLFVKALLSGYQLLTVNKSWVVKDVRFRGQIANSYRDTIAKKWKDFKIVDAGLPSYVRATSRAFQQKEISLDSIVPKLQNRIYKYTYPYWLINYRSLGAFPEAWGLTKGLAPRKFFYFSELPAVRKIKIYAVYYLFTVIGLLTPVYVFNKLKAAAYRYAKK
jgi:glycosyltransferase involved in cell wall biosynthesis